MPRIFLSYRRADTQTMTGRIYDRLVKAFKKENVFKDVNSIEAGEDFPEKIEIAIRDCDVLLVVIGRRWASTNGLTRLQNIDDWVRIEIEKAIELNKFIIPILINNTKMPSHEKFPDSLRKLGAKQAERVRDDPDFDTDVKRLIKKIRSQFPIKNVSIPTAIKMEWKATFFHTTNLTGLGIHVSNITDLNFNWGTGVPVINGAIIPAIGVDNFSAEFLTDISTPKGNYKFIASSDNGIRIFIDDAMILDRWIGRPLTTDEVFYPLTKGEHTIKVQYYHRIDQAILQVRIERIKS